MPFSTYLPEHMGSIELTPPGPFVAGSHAELTLIYTAGTFGIDDTGMVKISWRTTSDMSKPQFTEPAAANFTTVEASNGAKLEVWFDRLNIRPWANTLLIRVGRGYLRAGDTMTVRMGDRRQGSPGYRLQTNCEEHVALKTSVDAFATYEFTELPEQPGFDAGAGAGRAAGRRSGRRSRSSASRSGSRSSPRTRGAIRPAGRSSADACAVAADARIAGRDRDQARRRPVRARKSRRRRGRRSRAAGSRRTAQELARANPLRVVAARAAAALLGRPARAERRDHRHGIGGSYFRYARDKAFVDIVGHQGNDFQITDAFWHKLNRLTAEFDAPGRFVCLPGYEWSGNTGMGGDRNIFYRREGRPIRRSSHILVEGQTSTDAIYTARGAVPRAARRGRRGHRPCRRALRRHQIGP